MAKLGMGRMVETPEDLLSIWQSLTPEEQASSLPLLEKSWRLLRAVADPLVWMTGHTKSRDDQDPVNSYKPFPNRPYFRILYEAWCAEPVLLVEKSRTMMLTWLFAGFALHAMMTKPATSVIFWAQDEDRALKPLEYCWTFWEQQDAELKAAWPLKRTRDRQAYNRMELLNGSWALALPGKDPGKIRSEHPTIIVMDEAAHIEEGAEALDVALSTRVPKLVALTSAAPGWFRTFTKAAV